jgi:hypothetical protein
MISIALATALYVSAAPAGPPPQLRKNYSVCLNRFSKEKMEAKLDAETFKAAAKTACASEEAAFRKSIVDYDVKMGVKRAEAEEGATLQVEDYLINTADTYSVLYGEQPKPD